MDDHLSMPQKGDILYQRAVITLTKPSKVGGRTTLVLTVSNEHGVIPSRQLKGDNTRTIFEDNFRDQFAPDPTNSGVYITSVTFISLTEDDKVKFHRHDKNGRQLDLECFEKKEAFFKTHYLPSNDLSANLSPT